jgi:hypothetical protein
MAALRSLLALALLFTLSSPAPAYDSPEAIILSTYKSMTGANQTRGETIGLIGTSGNAVNVPHVHWELCTLDCTSHRDGDLSGTADPLSLVAGCFDPRAIYPTNRLVLTFPVECLYWAMERYR